MDPTEPCTQQPDDIAPGIGRDRENPGRPSGHQSSRDEVIGPIRKGVKDATLGDGQEQQIVDRHYRGAGRDHSTRS